MNSCPFFNLYANISFFFMCQLIGLYLQWSNRSAKKKNNLMTDELCSQWTSFIEWTKKIFVQCDLQGLPKVIICLKFKYLHSTFAKWANSFLFLEKTLPNFLFVIKKFPNTVQLYNYLFPYNIWSFLLGYFYWSSTT